MLEAHHRDVLASDGIALALNTLDERSRRYCGRTLAESERRQQRRHDAVTNWLSVYGVSAERIRQIEVAAMKKMKKTLVEFA